MGQRQHLLFPLSLVFKHPARTSRGVMNTKPLLLIRLIEDDREGWGEISWIRGLSRDMDAMIEGVTCNVLGEWFRGMPESEVLEHRALADFPAVRAGIEMAFRSLHAEHPFLWWESPFTAGRQAIPINGLIWMDDIDQMEQAAHQKIAEGFSCIKLKIGAHPFEQELGLIQRLRRQYGAELEIRVDANGAFSPTQALSYLEQLAALDVHSIEQPIAPGQPETMAALVEQSPLPIALDEELVRADSEAAMKKLIDIIRPHYIILKPSLIGGFTRSEQLLNHIRALGGDGWVTSALESNIGLTAIAQWTATLHPTLPQGLGTGTLYQTNFSMPLHISRGRLHWTGPPPNPQETIFPLL